MKKAFVKVVGIFILCLFCWNYSSAQCDFTVDDTAGCAPLVVHFIATGGTSTSKYEWDFGTGAGFVTASDTPLQVFATPKNTPYKVTLRITTGSSVCVVSKNIIHVLQTPTPVFTSSLGKAICSLKDTTILTDFTTDAVSREWIVDGVKDTHRVVHYHPSRSGTKSLSLKVTNKFGCTGYFVDPSYFTVSDTIHTDFCGRVVYSSSGVSADFSAFVAYSPQIANYVWHFYGGTPSTYTGKSPPTVSWPDNKYHSVSLTVVSSSGCTYTMFRRNYINPVVHAIPDTICTDAAVNFVNDTAWSNQPMFTPTVSLLGASTDPKTLAYKYHVAGSYDYGVSWASYKGGCMHMATVKNYITVVGPTPDFLSPEHQNCSPNDTVHFTNNTDTSADKNVRYTWHIYDTTGLVKPGHLMKVLGPTKNRDTFFIFHKRGKFTVTLIAKGDHCVDSIQKIRYIVIDDPKADFKADIPRVCLGSKTSIVENVTPPENKLIGYSYTYDWLATDADSPSLYYSGSGPTLGWEADVPGQYDVRLAIQNGPKCMDTIIKKRYITVVGVKTGIVIDNKAGCPRPYMKSTLSVSKHFSYYPPDAIVKLEWSVSPQDGVTIVDPTAKSTDVYFTKPNCYNISLKTTAISGKDTCMIPYYQDRAICVGPANGFDLPDNRCLGDTLPVNVTAEAGKYKWLISPKGSAVIIPNDTTSHPSIIYLRDTCINVSLVVTKDIDGGPCTDTLTNKKCLKTPEPEFTAPSKTIYCAPTTAEFYSTSKNAKLLRWDFGDGHSLVTTADTVAHVYTSITKPDFDITLTAYDSIGCGNSLTKKAFINVVGPVPFFIPNSTKACDNVTVQFTNKSKNVNNYYFFYGDDKSISGKRLDSAQIPSHTYVFDTLNLETSDSLNFYPTALSMDDSNCRVFYRDTITLYRSPKPAFKVSQNTGCVPFRVSFTDQSKFTRHRYWDFDNDGKIDDSTQNPVFTYKKAGKYSVKLIVRNGVCSDSILYKDMVEVLPVPNAVFTPSQGVVCGSAVVSFKNLSTDYVRYVFDYADGSQPDSNVMVPHKYYFDTTRFSNTDSIIYTPTLTAYNALGCPTVKMDTIVVYPNPIAAFTEDITSGCAPLTVHFKQNSKLAYKYYWDFENDGIIDTSGPSAVHTFSPGFYTVKMLARNYGGCTDSMVKVNLVSVNPVPVADFMVSDSDICVKQPVHFTDYTFPKANIRHWLWHFNEPKTLADTSTLENPQFAFLTPGYHTVSLAVQDFKGCVDTIIKKAIYVEDTLPPVSGGIDYVTVDDSSNIRVVWGQNPVRHFREYRISRYNKLGASLIDSVFNSSDTSFSDTGLAINANIQSYGYSLQTINGCGYLSSQSPVHATIRLLAQPANGFSKAVLSWSPYQGWNPVKYIILRSGDHFASSQKIDSVAGDQLSYLDSNLCDENYTYAVMAIDSSGRFYSRSNTSTARPPYQYQTAPLKLRYATVKDNQQVLVVWEPGYQLNAHKFVLDRKTGTEDWNQNFVTISSQDSFFDDNVNVFDNSYAYRIRSLDDCGYMSPNSNTGTSLLLKQKIADDKVLLRWNPYRTWGNGVNKYLLQVQQRNKKFRTVATLNGADTSYADDSVYTDIDTAYCYRLIAIEKAPKPDSSMSNIVCAVLPSRVYVPNAFSPNNDGLNDVWKPSALSIYNAVGPAILNFNAKIYDRWGTQLWESNNVNAGWDGTYQGRKVQLDTYIYIINADGIDGRSIHIKGNVTVIR